MGMSPQDYEYLLVAANLAHFHQKRGFSIKISKWKLFLKGHQFAITNCMGTVKVDTKKLDLNACINEVSPKHRVQILHSDWCSHCPFSQKKMRCKKIVMVE
jgi:hypothetical protein